MADEREDELALLDAMKRNETEFQWEYTNPKPTDSLQEHQQHKQPLIEGVMIVELELPLSPIPIQLDPSSGIYKQTSYTVDVSVCHLPPLKLHFQLDNRYPMESPPTYSLSSTWLNFSQLSVLCRNLDQIWSDNHGAAILHHWQQFISQEWYSVLNMEHSLTLKYQNPASLQSDWDPRAVQEMKNLLKLVPYLIEFDHQRKTEVFKMSLFPCDICLQTLQGLECVSLQGCTHVYCKVCVQGHITTKINEGSVGKIECPSLDCTQEIPPGIIQELISPKLFERYDKLLLQRTLESMTDIAYCPRPTCRSVTVKEENSNMAVCPSCKFAFCVLCKRTWHGVAPCKVLPEDIKELKESYESGDSNTRKSLEQQYGRQYLIHAFQEFDSCKWVKTNTQACPSCLASIEKDHGCNKMTCYKCNCNFCWLCRGTLPRHNPYTHFHPGNSPCAGKLFEGEIPED